MNCDPRGSIWRRWDLHFHTPASYDYENKGVTATRLVEKLVASHIEVVAITDHHSLDVSLICEMQELGAGRLAVLPGIELRSQLGGSESVHYIGIFGEDADLEDLWTKLQGLGITPADVKKKGDDKVFVPFEEGCRTIRDLGGVVTVHAGGKSHSIEKLSNAEVLKQAIKTEYVKRYLNAYEVGKVSDCDGYREAVFPTIQIELPLLLCSDNHDIEEYSVKAPMWIKADPGFLGLRQLLNEPASRIFLGDTPPGLLRADQQPTKYISGVRFGRTAEATAESVWFSGDIAVNHGLVAIIGRKGSGKSALADVLALLGNAHVPTPFSFLNKERFLDPKTKLGRMFNAEISWHSKHTAKLRLDAQIDATSPESVKYIPQEYLEDICTELRESTETLFYSELMGVIFSHVGIADRLGCESLPELIQYLTAEREALIQQVMNDVAGLNAKIAAIEEQMEEQYKKGLQGQLDKRLAELNAHDATKPAEVKEPEQDPDAVEAAKTIKASIEKLQLEAGKLDESLEETQEQLQQASLAVAAANKLLGRIEGLERYVESFLSDSKDNAETLELVLEELVVLSIDLQPIEDARSKAIESKTEAAKALDAETEDSPAFRRAEVSKALDDARLQLNAQSQRYQKYLEQLAQWKKARDEIEGSADEAGSVKGLEARLAGLAELPKALAERKQEREDLVKEIFATKRKLLSEYRALYSPVQAFIDEHPVSQDQEPLQFHASMAVDGLENGLLGIIHQGRKGSFQGEKEGRELLRDLIAESDFGSEKGVLGFLSDIIDYLMHDKQDDENRPVRVKDQLLQKMTPKDIYDFLFGLTYLKPRFELRWQGKPLDQLSPGERGNLLLVFYLLIDKRDMPLVVDQPEENLDNQTIATMLVPAIKHAKERRQVILVTHNPNLAVVCDADQVIHSALDKTAGNQVTYTTGALENPVVTQLIVDVLEGTKPAFDLRDSKYQLLESES